MKYQHALKKLYCFESRGTRWGIERTAEALQYLGSPERGMSFIQVAGTNGKGSVASMIAASLTAAGFRTGLYTSPHLHRYVERFRIDGRPIDERQAARRIQHLIRVFETPRAPDLSFFELTTLLAVEVFRDYECDISVLEVGLGGRLDSTTALPSLLSVITRVALDHTDILGNTSYSIAREKAGILRSNTPVVAGRCDGFARRAINLRATRLDAPIMWLDQDFVIDRDIERNLFDVRVGKKNYKGLKLGLLGDHQLENAACAVASLHILRRQGFRISNDAIRHALIKVKWPGRIERIAGNPTFVLDSAHNPDGCDALASYLSSFSKINKEKRVLIFGVMKNKDYPAMLQILGSYFHKIFFVEPKVPRAATCPDLVQTYPGTPVKRLSSAIRKAYKEINSDGLIVIAGSMFLVAEARALLLGVRSDPFIRM